MSGWIKINLTSNPYFEYDIKEKNEMLKGKKLS